MSAQPQDRDPGNAGQEQRETFPALLRHLANDMTGLFSKEIQLAKAEVFNSIDEFKTGLTNTAAGAMVLYAGLLVLLFAGVSGLSLVLSTWLSALIVGGVVSAIGLVMLGAGRKQTQIDHMKPEHSVESIKADKRAAKGAIS